MSLNPHSDYSDFINRGRTVFLTSADAQQSVKMKKIAHMTLYGLLDDLFPWSFCPILRITNHISFAQDTAVFIRQPIFFSALIHKVELLLFDLTDV